MVIGVAHNLKLDLLISLNALFNKNLVNVRELECVKTYLVKLSFVVGKATARTAEGKRGTKNNRVTDAGHAKRIGHKIFL